MDGSIVAQAQNLLGKCPVLMCLLKLPLLYALSCRVNADHAQGMLVLPVQA